MERLCCAEVKLVGELHLDSHIAWRCVCKDELISLFIVSHVARQVLKRNRHRVICGIREAWQLVVELSLSLGLLKLLRLRSNIEAWREVGIAD